MTINLLSYKLPRQLEAELKASDILERLSLCSRKIYEHGAVPVPVLTLTDDLKAVLLTARRAGHIVRGFDDAFESLNQEWQGINKLKMQSGQGQRVSRLLLMTNDGTGNFYHKAEQLLLKHSPRVLGCVIDIDCDELGHLLFGAEEMAKLILVGHKNDVSRILMSFSANNK